MRAEQLMRRDVREQLIHRDMRMVRSAGMRSSGLVIRQAPSVTLGSDSG